MEDELNRLIDIPNINEEDEKKIISLIVALIATIVYIILKNLP